MSAPSERTVCPRCGRTVVVRHGRYAIHSHTAHSGQRCRISNQVIAPTSVDETAFEVRAKLVADLAVQVQDEDPAVVWDYLTAMPADEVQRLLMVALAAVRVEDQTVEDIFAWVIDLPAAQVVNA